MPSITRSIFVQFMPAHCWNSTRRMKDLLLRNLSYDHKCSLTRLFVNS